MLADRRCVFGAPTHPPTHREGFFVRGFFWGMEVGRGGCGCVQANWMPASRQMSTRLRHIHHEGFIVRGSFKRGGGGGGGGYCFCAGREGTPEGHPGHVQHPAVLIFCGAEHIAVPCLARFSIVIFCLFVREVWQWYARKASAKWRVFFTVFICTLPFGNVQPCIILCAKWR